MLNLLNLDAETRDLMIREIEADVSASKLYMSPRLSVTGKSDYLTILKQAVQNFDDSWMASQLNLNGRLNQIEQRTTKNGITNAKVPVNAHETLAEGEFNRFYVRALCLRAIENHISSLIVFRAKTVSNPRPESNAKIGTSVDPQRLLNDLRQNIGIDTALGLPSGPNSGLSVKLP